VQDAPIFSDELSSVLHGEGSLVRIFNSIRLSVTCRSCSSTPVVGKKSPAAMAFRRSSARQVFRSHHDPSATRQRTSTGIPSEAGRAVTTAGFYDFGREDRA
jgi:hypothetical protein